MNNLYLISQDVNNGYDTFDSAVVVAESEEQAKLIHPNRRHWPDNEVFRIEDWTTPDNVQVQLIGTCVQSADDDKSYEAGNVICASYNAG